MIKDLPYNVDPDRIELEPGVGLALAALHAAGYVLAIVSNQSGVARGYFTEEALGLVEQRLCRLFLHSGAVLAGFYYCPHHPQGIIPAYAVECACRKPQPGLIFRAARDLHVDLGQSWMVGDILNDVEAGKRAGCRTLLVDNGHETEWIHAPLREPDAIVRTVPAAAELILRTRTTDPRVLFSMKGGLSDE